MSMNQERVFKILLAPLNTGKTNEIAEAYRQVTFKVSTDASKTEIKQAVEELFKVEVKNVRIVNVKPKEKRFRHTAYMRKAWKKAYVSLKEGFDINFATAES